MQSSSANGFSSGCFYTCAYFHLFLFLITAITTLALLFAALRSFYFHWKLYNFHLSSGNPLLSVFLCRVSTEGSEGCSLMQTRNVLPLSVMVLLLSTSICYIPTMSCFHCSPPNSLDKLLFTKRSLYRGSTHERITKALPL